MIRGFMKTSSLAALVAATGLILGNSAYAPAYAADLGGGCCADLEERVAELEATTARKGNRVVSLTVYGQVNKALLIWDDGIESDAYVVDNDDSGTRVGFRGTAMFKPGWTAGYVLEWDWQDTANDTVDQFDDDGDENEIKSRKAEIYIENEQIGRFTIGQGESASDGISEIILANQIANSGVDHGNFFVRDVDGNINDGRISDWISNLDGYSRRDRIRYDSPVFYGFLVSASWGEDDYYDLALRFSKEWNSVRFAAGVAYVYRDENEVPSNVHDIEQVSGSASIMHVPTGLYLSFAAGEQDIAHISPADAAQYGDPHFWYISFGLERRFLPTGTTTIFGEYGEYNNFVQDVDLDQVHSEATLWGFGITQKVDSAAMDLYILYRHYSFDDDTLVTLEQEDFSAVLIGSRIQF